MVFFDLLKVSIASAVNLHIAANVRSVFEAALLLDRIQRDFSDALRGNHFLQQRVPGWLGTEVVTRLNQALGETGSYHYSGLDAIEKALADNPLVQKYLKE
jgi:hypothetical protein